VKINKLVLGVAVVAGCVLGQNVWASDVPGFSVGGFYESRVDNRIDSQELSFSYFGGRIGVRDTRWIEGFVDLGVQALTLDPYESDGGGCFGAGGTFWFLRAEDTMVPLDIGAYGSYHTANSTITSSTGTSSDARYGWYQAQLVLRGDVMEGVRPYVRGGVMGSELDLANSSLIPEDNLDVVNPAVNIGIEFTLESKLTITVEGNYSEGVGGAAHLDLWF